MTGIGVGIGVGVRSNRGGAAGFHAAGVNLNGATYINRASSLLGASNANGLLSFWYRMPALAGTSAFWDFFNGGNNNECYVLFLTGPPQIQFFVRNVTDGVSFSATLTLPALDAAWHWLSFSYNLNFGAGLKQFKASIDGVTSTPAIVDAGAASSVPWTQFATSNLFADVGGTTRWTADVAELYFNIGTFRDMTTAPNMALFYNAGHPTDLGADGNGTGAGVPEIYLSVRSGGAASTFLTNRGTVGNFTVPAGALSLSALPNP